MSFHALHSAHCIKEAVLTKIKNFVAHLECGFSVVSSGLRVRHLFELSLSFLEEHFWQAIVDCSFGCSGSLCMKSISATTFCDNKLWPLVKTFI